MRAGKESAIMSKQLATIITNVPVEFHEENFKMSEWNKEALKEVFINFTKIKDFDGMNRRKNAAFITFDTKNENSLKSFRNFSNIELGNVKDLNPVDVLNYKYLVITNPEKSFDVLNGRMK